MERPEGKYAWTVTVGTKGQIVIPKEARDVFDIHPNRAWRSLQRILSRNTSKKYSTKPRKGRIVVCLYFWEFP